jgi:hypothetical protein
MRTSVHESKETKRDLSNAEMGRCRAKWRNRFIRLPAAPGLVAEGHQTFSRLWQRTEEPGLLMSSLDCTICSEIIDFCGPCVPRAQPAHKLLIIDGIVHIDKMTTQLTVEDYCNLSNAF